MSYGSQLADTQIQLKSFVTSKIFNEADAEDIIQNVNRAALKKADDFDKEKNFEAWVIGIAKFQIKDYLKKNKKSPKILSLDIKEEGEGFAADKNLELWLEDIPFASILVKERLELANQIRAALTKKQTMVFDLACQGFTSPQMAEKLNTSLHSVCITRYRMIKRAKAFLESLSRLNGYDYQAKRVH